MQDSLVKHLVCPATGRPLSLEREEKVDADVVTGILSATGGPDYPIQGGIPGFVDEAIANSQTVRSFSQKWATHHYYREHTRAFYTDWYLKRYGFVNARELADFLAPAGFILDAGTGAGRDAANFASLSSAIVFAVDTARDALNIARRQVDYPNIAFVQADLDRLPFPDGFFDFINCDQVIHHLPDPHSTFEKLSRKLKPGGYICCYVYKKKAVVREFVDDFVRERISGLSIEEASRACEGITRLGRTLANLKIEVEIEEDIPVLGIRKGRLDLQRFVHWNIMKCFWNDAFDQFTNNIVNVDWYHPEHCFRFTPEAFRSWFDHGWDIAAWDVQDAGISCRARKR